MGSHHTHVRYVEPDWEPARRAQQAVERQKQELRKAQEAEEKRQNEERILKQKIKKQQDEQRDQKERNDRQTQRQRVVMEEALRQQRNRLERIKKLEEETRREKERLRKLDEERKQVEKNLNSPQSLQALRQEQLQNFLKSLKTKKWNETFTNEFGVKNNVVVGGISVGKSSLLNYFFNLRLDVGISEVTTHATAVRTGKVTIWDSPGVNEDYDLTNMKVLKLFMTANKVFILYNTSLRSCKNEVEILATLKPNDTYCIRTMCDGFSSADELEATLKKDREVLAKWGFKLPVYGVSSMKEFADNTKLKAIMDS